MMKMKNKEKYPCLIIILIYLLIFQNKLSAQEMLPNGTLTTLAFVDTIKKNLADEDAFSPDTADYKIALAVYKINNIYGISEIDDLSIYKTIDLLNQYFIEANLQFHIQSIRIIDDYNYAGITSEELINEVTTLHAQANIINIFLVDSIVLDDRRNFGFTYYPIEKEKNYVFLQKEMLEGNYLISLMGNFFGLLPTHDRTGGIENANGSNCNESGDFICDTYADPNLLDLVSPEDCQYTGYVIDPNGEFYAPSVANFMSNSADNCKCIFTNEQYKRIRYYYRNYRNYLR